MSYRRNLVKKAAGLPPAQTAVLGELVDLPPDNCVPSLGYLVETTGYSESTVRRALTALRKRGLIRTFFRWDGKRQTSNLYRVDYALLRSMAAPARYLRVVADPRNAETPPLEPAPAGEPATDDPQPATDTTDTTENASRPADSDTGIQAQHDTPEGVIMTPPGGHDDTETGSYREEGTGKQRTRGNRRHRTPACPPATAAEKDTTAADHARPGSIDAPGVSDEALKLMRELKFGAAMTRGIIRKHGPAVTALLTEGGWTANDLAKHLENECRGAYNPHGRLVNAIRDVEPREPHHQPTAGTGTPWCGQCDDPHTRLMQAPDNSVYRCPTCHPRAAAARPPVAA